MKVKLLKSGLLKIHIEDDDGYNLTDDGVDIWLTAEQVKQIGEAAHG